VGEGEIQKKKRIPYRDPDRGLILTGEEVKAGLKKNPKTGPVKLGKLRPSRGGRYFGQGGVEE